jgi:hypothetical protein
MSSSRQEETLSVDSEALEASLVSRDSTTSLSRAAVPSETFSRNSRSFSEAKEVHEDLSASKLLPKKEETWCWLWKSISWRPFKELRSKSVSVEWTFAAHAKAREQNLGPVKPNVELVEEQDFKLSDRVLS